jgi:hypothetical protein
LLIIFRWLSITKKYKVKKPVSINGEAFMKTFLASSPRRFFVLASTLFLYVVMHASAGQVDDLVFIHHSSGENWLNSGLNDALLAKDYIDERNDITYGTVLPPDPGRPASMGDVPGDNTNMNHWILWFNDYLDQVKHYGSEDGTNRIIMFKSCFPISDVYSEGTEPGDPFSEDQTLANYRAVYRHPDGPGGTYSVDGTVYSPLEDVFARHPEILFIPVTAPPLCYGCTDDANAHRARIFNTWLKTEWLSSYRTAHPGLSNVAVFDWFDFLANPDDFPDTPNRLKEAYGGTSDDSHPNETANAASTVVFATGPNNFLDSAWLAFSTAPTDVQTAERVTAPQTFRLGPNYPNPFNPATLIPYEIQDATEIQLSVMDVMGKRLRTLVQGRQSAGGHCVEWDGREDSGRLMASGVYVVSLRAGGMLKSRKIILIQ